MSFNQTLWGGGPFAEGIVSSTPRQIIWDVLRMLRILRPGQEPDPATEDECARTLDELLDEWNAHSAVAFAIRRDVCPVTINKQPHTVGTGADLDIPRPVEIRFASWLAQAGGSETPLTRLAVNEWGMPHAAGQPAAFYYDCAFPEGNLYLFPVPSLPGNVVLYSDQQMLSVGSLTQEYGFPPAYLHAIKFNLASRYAPYTTGAQKYAAVDLARIDREAARSKLELEARNAKVPELDTTAVLEMRTRTWRKTL